MTNNKIAELSSEDLKWFANIIDFLNRTKSTSNSGIQIDKITFKNYYNEHTDFDIAVVRSEDLGYLVEFGGTR